MTFLIPRPTVGAAPSFMVTVQVIPALINTSGGTPSNRMRTGIRRASRTHVNVGLMEEAAAVHRGCLDP